MFPLTPDQHHWLEVATEDEGWCSFTSCTPSSESKLLYVFLLVNSWHNITAQKACGACTTEKYLNEKQNNIVIIPPGFLWSCSCSSSAIGCSMSTPCCHSSNANYIKQINQYFYAIKYVNAVWTWLWTCKCKLPIYYYHEPLNLCHNTLRIMVMNRMFSSCRKIGSVSIIRRFASPIKYISSPNPNPNTWTFGLSDLRTIEQPPKNCGEGVPAGTLDSSVWSDLKGICFNRFNMQLPQL